MGRFHLRTRSLWQLTKNSDLSESLKKAFAMKDKLVFVDIYVDPSEHVYPMQVANGSLENMWLSKDEQT